MYVIRTVFTGEAYWRIDYCQILRRSFFSIFSWQYNDLFQFFMPGTKTVDRRWMFEGQSCSCLEMVIRVFILSNHHIFGENGDHFRNKSLFSLNLISGDLLA